jgi:hypothetical protein
VEASTALEADQALRLTGATVSNNTPVVSLVVLFATALILIALAILAGLVYLWFLKLEAEVVQHGMSFNGVRSGRDTPPSGRAQDTGSWSAPARAA